MGFDCAQIAQIYAFAIQAIEKRSLVTLSSITVKVVADRVLHENREKFPLLALVTLEEQRMNTSRLSEGIADYGIEDVRNSLRHLLVQLLTVFGNITADILTEPLHRELLKITSESLPKLCEVRNREQS